MTPSSLPLARRRLPTDGAVRLPSSRRGPLRVVAIRLGVALLGLIFLITLMYVDRGGYRDTADDSVTLLDAVYYATVSRSTTGTATSRR